MINLQNLFDDLAHGELANMAVGRSQTTLISPDKYPRIVSLVNAGILAIHTELSLKEKTLNIHQRLDITDYYLRADHVGDPNGGDPQIYIDGTGVDPVDGDIIQLISAEDDLGELVYLNDGNYPDHLFTPQQDVVRMTIGDTLKVITITYKATLPPIQVVEGFNPITINIEAPSFITAALTNHISARLFTGTASQAIEGQPHPNSTFQYRYYQEIESIKRNFLAPELNPGNERFEKDGWV